jgi:hypothetical protein
MGSIYHRYKRVVQDSVDILDTCWKDFDYVKNFDPIGNNIDKTYSLSFDGVNRETIILQSYSAQTLPFPGVVIGTFTATTTTVQGGFYPKLINDCNMFFNGTDCFTTYSDTEIQLYVDSSLKVASIESGNILQNYISGTSLFNNFKMRPWSVSMKRTGSDSYYTIPSFGSQYNQVTLSVFGQKKEGNFEISNSKSNISEHPYYEFNDSENFLCYFFIKNKHEGKFLIPEQRQIDYFFFLINNNLHNISTVIQKIKTLPTILAAYEFDPTEFQSTENLIFE